MSSIEDSVAAKVLQRAHMGLDKYGISMADESLARKEWLIHAQEEAMDLVVYLEKLIQLEV